MASQNNKETKDEEIATITIDETDKKILEFLQEDSSQSHAIIADKVGVSIPTVRKRIHDMRYKEDRKVIKKYTVLLDEKKLGKDVTAFILITLDYKAYDPDVVVSREVAKIKDVMEVFHLAGDEDLLIKVKTENISTLEKLILRINRLNGVGRTRTIIVLSTEKEDTALVCC